MGEKEDIEMILRQTNYTVDIAKQHYLNYQKNTELVIKKYLEIPTSKTTNVSTKNTDSNLSENQSRIAQFRDLLNNTKSLVDK